MNRHASRIYPHRRDLTSVNAHRHHRERRERWIDLQRLMAALKQNEVAA